MTTTKRRTATKRSTQPAEVARAALERLAAHDLDGTEELWSPEIVEEFVPVGVFRGPAEVRGYFEGLLAAFPDFEITVRKIVGDEKSAFVEWRAVGTVSGAPFQGNEPTGNRIETRGVDHMEIEDGKIVRNTVYYDGMGFARGAGMLPDQGSGAERAIFAAFNAVTKGRKALAERRSSQP